MRRIEVLIFNLVLHRFEWKFPPALCVYKKDVEVNFEIFTMQTDVSSMEIM